MTRTNGTNSPPPGWPSDVRTQPVSREAPPYSHDGHEPAYQHADRPQQHVAWPDAGYPAQAQPGAQAAAAPGYNPWQDLQQAAPAQPHGSYDAAPPDNNVDTRYHYPGDGSGASQQSAPAADPSASYQPQFDTYQPARHAPYGGQDYDPAAHSAAPSGFGAPPSRPAANEADWGLRGSNFDHREVPAPANGYDMPDGAGHPGYAEPPNAYGAPAYEPSLSPGYGSGPQQAYDPAVGAPLTHDAAGQPLPGYDPHAPVGSGRYDLAPHENGYDTEYDDADYEPPRGFGRKVLIGGALAASIAVGGGIAYGYNVLFGVPSGKDGAPPVVRADGTPSRVEPTDPGGKKFPHTESAALRKMGQRLPPGAGEDPKARAEKPRGDGRVKAVTTMTFDRQGRMVVTRSPQEPDQPAASAEPPPDKEPSTPSGGAGAVPGLTIMNGNGFGPPGDTAPRTEPPQRTEAPPPPRVVAVTRAQPVGTPAARPPQKGMPPLPTRSTIEKRPIRTARVAPQPPAVRTAPTSPPVTTVQPRRRAPPPAGTGRSPASNGYVAVLATKGSRMAALKRFVDLQTKYASVLGAHIPAVQKADLSARNLGIQYRAVVGPPGSRRAALAVCSKLRAAGYQGCWVKAY